MTPTLTVLPREQVLVAGFAPGGRGRLSVTGDTEPGGLIGYQGNQQKGPPLMAPLISRMEHLDLKLEQSLTREETSI